MTEFSRNRIVKLESKMDTSFKLQGWKDAKGLVYPSGNVYMWGFNSQIEHVDAADIIRTEGIEKNKPIFAFYFWEEYSDAIPYCVTTSVSNQGTFFPKFLRKHDEGKLTYEKLDPILNLVPAEWICFDDAFVDGRTGKVSRVLDPVNALFRKMIDDNLSVGEYR